MNVFSHMASALTKDPEPVARPVRSLRPKQGDTMFALLEQHKGNPVCSIDLARAAGTRTHAVKARLMPYIKANLVGFKTKQGTYGQYWLITKTPDERDLEQQLQAAAELLRRHGWSIREKPALVDAPTRKMT